MHETRHYLRRGAVVAVVVGVALVAVVAFSTAPPGASADTTTPALHIKARDGRGGLGRRVITRAAASVASGAGFSADRLFDGDPTTGWCLPAGKAEGAILVLTFDRTVTFDQIDLTTGVEDNAPHRTITTLAFSDLVHKYTVDLEAGEKELELGLDPAMRGKRISMRIVTVDPKGSGSACLSELSLSYHKTTLGPFTMTGAAATGAKPKAKPAAKAKMVTPT